MKLSQINTTPLYPVRIPSTGKNVNYRPFLVKEERALLAAQQSEDPAVMLVTLKQVVENCITPSESVDDMTSFDLEYLFTLIRAKSVGEFSDLIFSCDTCEDDKAKVKISVDLRKVQVFTSEKHNKKIKLSDKITLLMRHPTMEELIEIQEMKETDPAKRIRSYTCVIESIYAEDEVFHVNEETDDELQAFIDSLTSSQFALIEEYINTIPTAQIAVDYTCPVCKKEHKKVIKGINNFF